MNALFTTVPRIVTNSDVGRLMTSIETNFSTGSGALDTFVMYDLLIGVALRQIPSTEDAVATASQYVAASQASALSQIRG